MLSSNVKYIGLDVHKEATTVAVRDAAGKLVMESIVETKARTLLDLLDGLRGELHVTLEEGTWAAWLYDVIKPHVKEIVVCNPRRNALLKEGSKDDKVDPRKLSELLRGGLLRAVYHGENGLRTLRELARSHQVVSKDLMRVMSRIKALYRSWGIPCTGTKVYTRRHREQWLQNIQEPGVHRRAELFYQQLDGLQSLRRTVRRELVAESRKIPAVQLLRKIPFIGPLRAAQLVALMQTPHRFRSKRQLWTYSGLAVVTHDSAQYRYVDGQLQRSKKPQQVRGLNQNHNHAMKDIFKSAALSSTLHPGPFQDFYAGLLAKGMKPEMARLTLARKIASITLTLWKKGAAATPLGWLYKSETLRIERRTVERLAQLEFEPRHGSAAKAVMFPGALLPDKGAWLWYWRLCRWWRRCPEKDKGPTPLERLIKFRRPGRATLNSTWSWLA